MDKSKYIPPRCIDIDPTTVKDPKIVEAIQKLQQMARENRNSGEIDHYFIEIDPPTMKGFKGLEAIQTPQQFGQETREGWEEVKRSRLLLRLNRPPATRK